MRRWVSYAALVGVAVFAALNVATFFGVNAMSPPLFLLLPLGMLMGAIGALLVSPPRWPNRGTVGLFEAWNEREAAMVLDDRARNGGTRDADVMHLAHLLRPRRAAIGLLLLTAYAALNVVVTFALDRGGSVGHDESGHFLFVNGNVIARLSDSDAAWSEARLMRMVTSLMMAVYFLAYCVWRMPSAPRAEVSQDARRS